MNGNVTIDVNAKLTIPDETAKRCMTLLEMWMDDNPDKNIVCDLVPCKDAVKHRLRIQTLKQEAKE
jgi:hypothetical protein